MWQISKYAETKQTPKIAVPKWPRVHQEYLAESIHELLDTDWKQRPSASQVREIFHGCRLLADPSIAEAINRQYETFPTYSELKGVDGRVQHTIIGDLLKKDGDAAAVLMTIKLLIDKGQLRRSSNLELPGERDGESAEQTTRDSQQKKRSGLRRTSSLDSPLSTKLGNRATDGDSQLNLLKDRACPLLPGSRWLTRDVLPSLSAILSPFSAAITRLSPISSAHEPSTTQATKDAKEFGSHFNVRRPSFPAKRSRSV